MPECIFAVMIATQVAVCIHPDATVTYAPNIDVAAKAFWDEVAKRMPLDDCKSKISAVKK